MALYLCPFCKTNIEDGIDNLIAHRKSECEEIALSKMSPEEKLLLDIFGNKHERKKTMDIKKARRQTYDIEYVVVTEENFDEVAEWCGGEATEHEGTRHIRLADKNARNARQGKAFVDDYVLKYGSSFKSYSKRAFYKSFEDIEDSGDNSIAHSHKIARSAKDGKFVTPEEALRHPETTVVEEIPREIKPDDFEAAQGDVLAPDETPTEDLRGL